MGITIRLVRSTADRWGNDAVREYLDKNGIDITKPIHIKEHGPDLEYTGYAKEEAKP